MVRDLSAQISFGAGSERTLRYSKVQTDGRASNATYTWLSAGNVLSKKTFCLWIFFVITAREIPHLRSDGYNADNGAVVVSKSFHANGCEYSNQRTRAGMRTDVTHEFV